MEFLKNTPESYTSIDIYEYYDVVVLTLDNETQKIAAKNGYESSLIIGRLLDLVYEKMTNLTCFSFSSRFIGEYESGFLNKSPASDKLEKITVLNHRILTPQFVNKSKNLYLEQCYTEDDEELIDLATSLKSFNNNIHIDYLLVESQEKYDEHLGDLLIQVNQLDLDF